MKKDLHYRLRFLFLAVYVVGLYLYSAFFLGPALAVASNTYHLDWLSYPLRHLSYYWTGTEDSLVVPGYMFSRFLGTSLHSDWFGFGSLVGVALVLAIPITTGIFWWLFLWPAFRLRELPATRKLGLIQKVICAFGWGVLFLSFVCLYLDPDRGYRSFERMDYECLRGTPLRIGEPTPLAFGLVVLAGTLAAFGLIQFIQRRRVQFWILERMSFWLLAVGSCLTFLSVALTSNVNTHWYYDYTNFESAFLASSVLLWAASVRLWLMFQYRRFVKAQSASDEVICIACGYDLRGSIGQISCPECGLRIETSHLANEE